MRIRNAVMWLGIALSLVAGSGKANGQILEDRIRVGMVYFNEAEKDLDETDRTALDEVSTYLKDENTVAVVVGGASQKGAEIPNLRLSFERSNNTAAYLVRKGIPTDRIIVLGTGKFLAMPQDVAEDRKVKIYLFGSTTVKEKLAECGPDTGGICVEKVKEKDPPIDLQPPHVCPVTKCPDPRAIFTQPPPTPVEVLVQWTLRQRLVASSVTGLLLGTASAVTTYGFDVHDRLEPGHYKVFRNLNWTEGVAFGGGFVGGFVPTLVITGHFYTNKNGHLVVKLGGE
ncbi:OmpA family protein [Candidatus Uhrbacteria bacterium]|nr:OmpA family protein [Candidatus Uhrbacteria bacterium]